MVKIVKGLIAVAVGLLTLALACKAFIAAANSILISNYDPRAVVLVNDSQIRFSNGATGSYELNPFFSTYRLEVRSRRGVQRWIISPLAEGSDSGSVSVKGDGVTLDLKNDPLP